MTTLTKKDEAESDKAAQAARSRFEERLQTLRAIVDWSYAHGFHEVGYDAVADTIAARDAEWSHAVSDALTLLDRLAEGVCGSLETSPLGRLMDAAASGNATEGRPLRTPHGK